MKVPGLSFSCDKKIHAGTNSRRHTTPSSSFGLLVRLTSPASLSTPPASFLGQLVGALHFAHSTRSTDTRDTNSARPVLSSRAAPSPRCPLQLSPASRRAQFVPSACLVSTRFDSTLDLRRLFPSCILSHPIPHSFDLLSPFPALPSRPHHIAAVFDSSPFDNLIPTIHSLFLS